MRIWCLSCTIGRAAGMPSISRQLGHSACFQAKEWQWAADLIEQTYPPLVSLYLGSQ